MQISMFNTEFKQDVISLLVDGDISFCLGKSNRGTFVLTSTSANLVPIFEEV